jgi:hypothetical protein
MPLDATISNNEIFTGFATQSATTKFEMPLDLTKLAEFIKTTRASTKAELPWIKCARFGDVASERGSLRYDGNVKMISGIEGDYDAGEISLKEAAALIQEAKIEALLYSTPSSTPVAPRWRVLAPLGYERTGDESTLRELRSQFLARLNGVLGGVLAPESFVLSQAFYCGGINGGAEIQVEYVNKGGARIDELSALDAGAIGRKVSDPRAASAGVDLDSDSAIYRAREYLRHVEPAVEGQGGDRHTMTTAAAVKDLGVSEDRCLELMADLFNPRCDPPWQLAGLTEKVANAYRYCTENAPGCDAVGAAAKIFAGAPLEALQRGNGLAA